jgi:hypothetical protein
VSDLSPEARRLLAAASDADDPTPSDEARIARALAVPLGIAALAPTAAQATALATTGAVTTFKTVAVVVAVLAVGAGTLTVRASRHHHDTAPAARHTTSSQVAPRTPAVHPSRATAPATIVPSRAAEPVALAAPAVPSVTPEERPRTAHGPRAEAPTEDSLRAESELLGDAHRAVGSGDAARALSLLQVYRARFPHGVMREERDVEAVLALCALGREHEARAAGQRFLRAHPRSPLSPRVLQSCARTISSDAR